MSKVVIGSGRQLRIDRRRVRYRDHCFIFISRGLNNYSIGSGKKLNT